MTVSPGMGASELTIDALANTSTTASQNWEANSTAVAANRTSVVGVSAVRTASLVEAAAGAAAWWAAPAAVRAAIVLQTEIRSDDNSRDNAAGAQAIRGPTAALSFGRN